MLHRHRLRPIAVRQDARLTDLPRRAWDAIEVEVDPELALFIVQAIADVTTLRERGVTRHAGDPYRLGINQQNYDQCLKLFPETQYLKRSASNYISNTKSLCSNN